MYEEIDVAAAINQEMLGVRGELVVAMQGITDTYTSFALPFVNHLSGEIQPLHPPQPVLPAYDLGQVDLSFYNSETVESTVNLGLAEQRVEQVVAYPYPTMDGMLYIRLMKVCHQEKSLRELPLAQICCTQL
ncbi:MAG: hypothetical protein JNK26_05510 [Candidatus Doudnabacteria bacterium]|nr:hypothetical protein [Candidatus Doudnabacteria bacterium]